MQLAIPSNHFLGSVMVGALDRLFLIFFIIHIPITLLIDVNGPVVPKHYYPEIIQRLTTWYAVEFEDFLMANPPVWFRSFIYAELFFQLPLLLLCTFGLYKKRSWAQITCLIYGVHVTTTCIPIVAEFVFSELAVEAKGVLLAIYSPYIIIPGLMALRFALYPYPNYGKTKKK